MPSPLLQLRIPQDLADWLEAKYPSRGEVAEYVRQLLTAEQMKEAVAPLVPEFASLEILAAKRTSLGEVSVPFREAVAAAFGPVDLECQEAGGECIFPNCSCKPIPEAESKPKARRKKGVQVVVSERAVLPEDIQIPARCHCGRGMIIAAGPRKGQCTVCGNPKPLKEPT